MRKGKLCYFASLELLIRKSFFVIHIFPVESKESGHFIHYNFFFFKEFKQRRWVFKKNALNNSSHNYNNNNFCFPAIFTV